MPTLIISQYIHQYNFPKKSQSFQPGKGAGKIPARSENIFCRRKQKQDTANIATRFFLLILQFFLYENGNQRTYQKVPR